MAKLFATLLMLLLAGSIPLGLYLLSSHTTLAFDPPVAAVGIATPVGIRLENAHGVRRITAAIEQDGVRHALYESTKPASRVMFWRKHESPVVIHFQAGKDQAPALHSGKARLVVDAVSNDLRASTDSVSIEVNVITEPPRVTADAAQHYINQGGCELVTFSPSGYWTEAGVKAGEHRYRSFAMPGGQRFSLFAYPWDMPVTTAPLVYVANPTGNEVTAHFWFKVFPKKFRRRNLEIDDRFLNKVVSELDPGGTGELIERFLRINGPMRRQNNQTLASLRLQTEERVLWSGPFLQLGNSKVESQFADVRTYIYHGKKVDEQVHLGFDLSVTRGVGIVAANSGKVIHAGALGIYGNCIVVDHGYGLQSIYGHLSEIGVKAGDMVTKGQVMGKSGSTGLAGGDHLHYSMQVDGVQVNPIEWWDEHWIRDRILSKLEAAAPASASSGLGNRVP